MKTRLCPHCEKRKPLTAFGKNKARTDGLHLYCRPCANVKTLGHRELIKDMRAAKRAARIAQREREKKPDETRPEQRVLFAIKQGARTQTEIAKQARLLSEDLGLALVKLIIEEKKVFSLIIGKEREYYLRAA